MEPKNENIQNLKKDEVTLKKEELDKLKAAEKELADYKTKELEQEVEELAKLELAIGRTSEENLASRTEILMKLSTEERKVLKDSYDWVSRELSEKSPEEMFVESMSEDMRGKIPPGLRKFIEDKKKSKKEEEMAKLTPEEKKKKEEEEKNLADKGKYPYPEKNQKLNEDFETLSNSTEQLVGKNNLNRFQELSAENKDSNQEFLDTLNMNQGTFKRGSK